MQMIRSLRCSACNREPTDEEAHEMLANFGHKLKGKPLRAQETLVWNCSLCFQQNDDSASN